MTFAYNEAFYLPLWIRYYGGQLGLQNLFVLDHGSTDGSTSDLGPVNVLRVPRTVYDEVQRVLFASSMHAALLQYFQAGFVMDVDEFIVADPERHRNLCEFAKHTEANALACIGLELFHLRKKEGAYRGYLPILAQRRHVLFDSWLCKRSFGRIPMRFGGGFHTSDQPVQFDNDLYLIHLKNFDYHHRLIRQQITASWTYAGDYGEHARKSVESVNYLFDGIDDRDSAGTTTEAFSFETELGICRERTMLNPSGEYDFNLQGGTQSVGLHLLPDRFRGLF
jgi:hypothetical protein